MPGKSAVLRLDPDRPGLADLLSYRLSVVSNLLSRTLHTRLNAISDISLPEWRVLVLVGSYQPLPVKSLAIHAGLDFGQASRLVRRMCELGHMVKQPTDDGRSVNLSLTPRGRALHRKLWDVAMACNDAYLAELSAAQRTALFGALDVLAATAKADLADGASDAGTQATPLRTRGTHRARNAAPRADRPRPSG